jgi:tRNA-modifying protein YgfZ
MRHKTELRKGLVRVDVEGEAPPGTPIQTDGRAVGVLYSQSEGRGIAHLRFARSEGEMRAGEARITWDGQARSE